MKNECTDALKANFLPGSLVTIEWVSEGHVYDPQDHGYELDAPEPALVVRLIPKETFRSYEGRDVIPFECLHRGSLRASTTYASQLLGSL